VGGGSPLHGQWNTTNRKRFLSFFCLWWQGCHRGVTYNRKESLMKRLLIALLFAGALSQGTYAAVTGTPAQGQCVFIQSNSQDVLFFTLNITSSTKYYYIPITDSKYETFLSLLLTSRTKGLTVGGGYESTESITSGGVTWYRMVYLQLN
jgi:hypothetical protein